MAEKKRTPEEEYSEIYRKDPVTKDIDLERFKQVIEEKELKYRNSGIPKAKRSKMVDTPLEEMLNNFNNAPKKNKIYPEDD